MDFVADVFAVPLPDDTGAAIVNTAQDWCERAESRDDGIIGIIGIVIANAAKQSMAAEKGWIASSLRSSQ